MIVLSLMTSALAAPVDAALPSAQELDGGVLTLGAGAALRDVGQGFGPDVDPVARLGAAASVTPGLNLNAALDAHTTRWSAGAAWRLEAGSVSLGPTLGVLGYLADTRPDVVVGLALAAPIGERFGLAMHWPLLRPLALLAEHEPLKRATVPYGLPWIPLISGSLWATPGDDWTVGGGLNGSSPMGGGLEAWGARALTDALSARATVWMGLEPLSPELQPGVTVEVAWLAW